MNKRLLIIIIFVILLNPWSITSLSTKNSIKKVLSSNNTPPNPPKIFGKTFGEVGEQYKYTFVATDPDGDDLCYYIDWGDGSVIITRDLFPSGEPVFIDYIWQTKGEFIIRAKVQDTHFAPSDWGYLEVSMPKINPRPYWLLFQILERLNNYFPILKY
jgi:hypothetical protein